MPRFLALLAIVLVAACDARVFPVAGEPGEPLPNLTTADSLRFLAGRMLFNRVYTPDEGLGPAFNENQCSACHTVPAIGGTTGFERVVKATRYGGAGRCDVLAEVGGQNVRTQVTPPLRAQGIESERVPPGATEVGRFLPPLLFGLGLVEAIPEEVLLAQEDPDDRDGDGISGRAARDEIGRVTRFGWKADSRSIDDFTRGALHLEMGLTSRSDQTDRVNGAPPPEGTDPAPEPEVSPETVDGLVTFIRFLAPPAQASPRSPAHADTLAWGRRLFQDLGCSGCHTPVLRTGASDEPALAHERVRIFSDLLLHDMGEALANVCAADASPREVRTSMLMGLRHRQFFLHDGRARDLREAILLHGGEAQTARDAFASRSWLEQEFLVLFLRTL